jgi:RHS repeat-associated protein
MNHGMIRFIATLFLACLSLMAQGVEEATYYHNDALGSPIIATDQEGRVVWRKSYAPYGQPIGQTAPNEPGYTGKFEEPDLGIQDFGARWYDPRIGRFLAIDPAGFDPQNPQSFNRYAYANNNPYKYVDPDERVPLLLPFIVGLGLELGNLALEAYDNGANACGDCVRSSGVSIPGTGALAKTAAKAAEGATEVVQRAMSRAELTAIQESGVLSKGGRAGPHYVSDAVNSSGNRARQRLGLPTQPEVRATMEVPSGVFSRPSKIEPFTLPNGKTLPGGGTERTAPGKADIPARILDTLEY